MDAKRLNKEICSRAEWVDILNFVDNNLHAMDQVNLCTALHRSAKDLRSKSRDITRAVGRQTWDNMLRKLSTLLALCKPRELSNCVWALAVVDKKDEAFLEAWCPVASSMLPQYLPQNLSNTLWAVAKLQWCPLPGFLDKLVDAGMKQRAGFSPQDVANFNWSLVRMQNLGAPSAQDICPLLCQASMHLLPQFQPQNISNIIWSLATAQVKGQTAFIHATLNEGLRKLDHFKPQELANTMWALATLNIRADKFILGAIDHFVPQLSRTCCQDLSNTMWAIGFLKVRPRNELIRAINWQIIRTMSTFSGQGLSNIIWGLAMLDYRDQMLLDAFTAELTRRLKKSACLIPTDVSTILYSFAVLYWNAPDAIQLLLQRLEVVKCSARDVSNICWALASIGVRYDDLVLSLTDHLTTRVLEEMNVQGLCNTVWALCRFSLRPPRLPAIVIKHLENPEAFGPSDIFLLGDAVVSEWADLVGATNVRKVEKLVQLHYDPVEAFFLDKSNFACDGEEARKRYRDAISTFSIVHLGRNQTKVLLEVLGIGSNIPEPTRSKLEALRNAWLDLKSEVLSDTDASLVHKTVCAFDMDGEDRVVASGSPLDVPIVFEFCTLEHSRASDAEFQIVNILAAQPGLHAASLSVSEIPCISCMGALAQFRLRFPQIALALEFDLRKVPGTPLVPTDGVPDVEMHGVKSVPPLQSSGSRLLMVKPPPAKSLMLAASPVNSLPAVVVSDDETIVAAPEDFRQAVRSFLDPQEDLDGSVEKCVVNGVPTPCKGVPDGSKDVPTDGAAKDAARHGTGAGTVVPKGAIGEEREEQGTTMERTILSTTTPESVELQRAGHEYISVSTILSAKATTHLLERAREKAASPAPLSVEHDVVLPPKGVNILRISATNVATNGMCGTPIPAQHTTQRASLHDEQHETQTKDILLSKKEVPSLDTLKPPANSLQHVSAADAVNEPRLSLPASAESSQPCALKMQSLNECDGVSPLTHAGAWNSAAPSPTNVDTSIALLTTTKEVLAQANSALGVNATAVAACTSVPTEAPCMQEEPFVPLTRAAGPATRVLSAATSPPELDVSVRKQVTTISQLNAADHEYKESSVPAERVAAQVVDVASPTESLSEQDHDISIKSSAISVLAAVYHACTKPSAPTKFTVGAVSSAISSATARRATVQRANEESPIPEEQAPNATTITTSSAVILPLHDDDTTQLSASPLTTNGVDATAPTMELRPPSAAKEDAPFALPAAVVLAPVRTSSSLLASSHTSWLPQRSEPRSGYKDPLFRYTNQAPRFPAHSSSSVDPIAASTSRPAASSSSGPFPSGEPRGRAAPGRGFHVMRWSRDANHVVSSDSAMKAAELAGQQQLQTFYPARAGRGLMFGMANADRFAPAAQVRTLGQEQYFAGSSSSGEWRTEQCGVQHDAWSRISRQNVIERMCNDQMDSQAGGCGAMRSFYRR